MTPKKRFLLGGGGALMPVLVSLLAIDIGAALSDGNTFSTGNSIGLAIRYIVLFIVGGVVAYLHEDEKKSFKLFELGIAAPALITSLITAQGIVGNPTPGNNSEASRISFIDSAYAGETNGTSEEIILAGGLFSDIIDGISGKAYRDIKVKDKKASTGNTKKSSKPEAKKKDKPVKRGIEMQAPDEVVASDEPALQMEQQVEEQIGQEMTEEQVAEHKMAQAKIARAKADALEKQYQESLAQAKAAEEQAEMAAEKIKTVQPETN